MGTEEVKKQIMQEVESTIDEMLKQSPPGTEITIKQIESLVGEAKSKIGSSISQALAETVVADEVEGSPHCEACGDRLRSKGHHAKTVQSEQGELTFEREYLYCPQCEQGFFPPR